MRRKTLVALACALLASLGLATAAISAKPGPALPPGKPDGVLKVLTRWTRASR